MKSSKLSGARLVVAAIAFSAAVLAYADARDSVAGPAADREATPARSSLADEAEAKIAHANPARKLARALGDAFGGVWFESSTAQLHVGVTSAASRRVAEAVVAGLGLAGDTTETPVRSTWAELIAAQQRWNRLLAGLLRREEAATALTADGNAVEVELGTAVPPAERAAMRQLASEDDVSVSIAVADVPRLRVRPQKRCSAFTAGTARCETPIVSGVTIDSEKVGGKIYVCTAGPPAIRTKPTTLKERTEVFILTAGHCIQNGGGTAKWWKAYKQDIKVEPPLIGKAIQYIYPKTDIGVIEVGNPGHWTSDGPIPLTPTMALWGESEEEKEEETEPINITGETEPVQGSEVCISGQRSANTCGEIENTNVTSNETENLVRVKGTTTLDGDSGAPWYVKSSPSLMVGVHKGLFEGTTKPVFHSLTTSFEKLKEKSLDLELLTKPYEVRHPTFTAEKYPAKISAEDTTSKDQFTAFGSTVSCTKNEFDGEVAEPEVEWELPAIELTPNYSECTAGGLPVKVTNNGCKFKFTLTEKATYEHYKAEVDVVCPGGEPGIEFGIYVNHTTLTGGSALCSLFIPPQSGLKTITLTNGAEDIVADASTIEGVKVKMHRDTMVCPSTGTEIETTSGVYHVGDPVTVLGSSGEEEIEIDMIGG